MAETPSFTVKSRASILSYVPVGEEKALKQAFYNTAASLFVISVCCAGYAVYLILETFLRPLLWAVLVGTFLHPFKLSFTCGIRSWLKAVQQENTPFIVGFTVLPLKIVNSFADSIYNVFISKWKLLLGITAFVSVVYLLYYYDMFGLLFSLVHRFTLIVYNALDIFSSGWMYTLVIAYIILVLFSTAESGLVMRLVGLPVWGCVILNVVSIAGNYRIFVLGIVLILIAAGVYAQFTDGSCNRKKGAKDGKVNLLKLFSKKVAFMKEDSEEQDLNAESEVTNNDGETAIEDTDVKQTTTPHLAVKRGMSQSNLQMKKKRKLSDYCFVALLWYIIAVRLWTYIWILQLLMLPIVFVVIKKVFMFLKSQKCYVEKYLNRFNPTITLVVHWLRKKMEILVPDWIHGLIKIMIKGDKKILQILDESVDKIMSTALILMLLLGAVVFTVLLAVQVHNESMELIHVVSNVVNDTVQKHPGLSDWLPEGPEMDKTMDSIVDSAQLYGKDWISSVLDNYFQGKEEDRQKVEHQLLQLWNGLAKSLTSKPENSVVQERSNFSMEALRAIRSFEIMPWEDVASIVKDNVETLTSVLQSIYTVIIGNVNIAVTIVSAVVRMLLGGGTAVLNFVIYSVIFLTALSILLTSSKEQYLPMEWFQKLIPSSGKNNQSQLAVAVEEAISGVFMASLKMAAFYGLYTWHTYILFECKIVFIPAALACVFAVVPVLGTYWAFLPGALELYLSGRTVHALLLAAFQFVPTMIVDTAFYSDIKGGGHPYLTGLAVAGGIFWLGLEGAIVGPILLCCLIVAVNVYSVMLTGQRSDTSTPSTPQHPLVTPAFGSVKREEK